MDLFIGHLEKFVYDRLKDNPRIKNILRNLYQDTLTFLSPDASFSASEIKARSGYFYGFHDTTPFSFDDSRLLSHSFKKDLFIPTTQDRIQVGYFDLNDLDRFVSLSTTGAWNWHKGSRLQWVDEASFIFNDFDGSYLCSRVLDVNGEELQRLPLAIDSISKLGEFATSFCYETLQKCMPGYGYRSASGSKLSRREWLPSELVEISLATSQANKILDVSDLKPLSKLPSGPGVSRFVTHTSYSFDDRYILFIYRSVEQQDLWRRTSELFSFDRVTGKLYRAPTSGMVSHYDIGVDDRVVVYCSIDGVDGHYCFDSPMLNSYVNIYGNKIQWDGHQHINRSDPSFAVIDTYPDRSRYVKLKLVHLDSGSEELLATLKSPRKFRAPSINEYWVCDLHPRMNRAGDMVCFDSTYLGQRSLCTMPIPKFDFT